VPGSLAMMSSSAPVERSLNENMGTEITRSQYLAMWSGVN